MTIEIDYDELNETIETLTSVTGVDEPAEELLTAANFVFRFGALGEFLEEPALSSAQMWVGPAGAAFSSIGHWSVYRSDPTGGREPGRDFEVHADSCDICGFLENTLDSRRVFEFELCEECGGDVGSHAVVMLPIGEPGLMCVGQWVRVEPEAYVASPLVHETQRGPSFSARWQAPLADGTWAVVIRTYFVRGADRRDVLTRIDEYIVCSDQQNGSDVLTGDEIAATTVLNNLDSDEPAFEDIRRLAVESFPPDPGEWQDRGPDSPVFAVPVHVA